METATPFQTYSSLLNMLKTDDLSREEVYNTLMQKEKNVLNVVNRMADKDHDKHLKSNLFIELSLSDLIARFAYTWQNIFNELVIQKRFHELPVVLFQNERKFYVGVMLLIVAVFLFVIGSE